MLSSFDRGILNNPLYAAFSQDAFQENPFFTPGMQSVAIKAICKKFLYEEALEKWVEEIGDFSYEKEEVVGIINAGNIPLAGFHDMICALACGFRVKIKLSSKDRHLPLAILELLYSVNAYWKGRVEVVGQIPENIRFLIASGSDDSISAIEKSYPAAAKLLRGSRSSMAIISGNETHTELEGLADDIFTYFGLGCRSVSTLLVPSNYNINLLSESFSKYREQMLSLTAWSYSYRQNRALLTLEGKHFYDCSFFLLSDFGKFPPPIAGLNIYRYNSKREIDDFLELNSNHLQAICSKESGSGFVQPGQMQYPSLNDYADGINTPEFLKNHFYSIFA